MPAPDVDDITADFSFCKERTIFDCNKFNATANACDDVIVIDDNSSNSLDSIPGDIIDLLNNPPPLASANANTNYQGWIMGCAIYADATNCHKCYAHKYINE